MRRKAFVPLAAILLFVLSACSTKYAKEILKGWIGEEHPASLETRRLSLFDYEDKLMGAWAGKMIGSGYANTNNFQAMGTMLGEEAIAEWRPEAVEVSLKKSDLYVQMTFLKAVEEKGLQITSREGGKIFADTDYPLDHANQSARENIKAGIQPPDSGNPRHNPHADDLSFQTEADLFGILCPGMPRTAIQIAQSFGAIMSYGDGLYGGFFIAGMYSSAYFENDRIQMIENGLKCIPDKSHYAMLIRDVLEFYRGNPSDWTSCWQMLESKWSQTDLCPDGYGKPFNADAKLNGGYVVIGLLYGEGDFAKTINITARCGQASTSNAASAAGLLGLLNGFSRIPREFKDRIPILGEKNYLGSDYNFMTLTRTCQDVTTLIIKRFGGEIQRLGEREYFAVPTQNAVAFNRLDQFSENMRTVPKETK